MTNRQLTKILALAQKFASSYDEVMAMALCGSQARGTAGPESDIDLSIIVTDKDRFRKQDWIQELDFESIDDPLDHFKDKAYGRVWSRHVYLKSGTAIEFSFADLSWADTQNLDVGTRRVVTDGYRIIYDPQQLLLKLVAQTKE